MELIEFLKVTIGRADDIMNDPKISKEDKREAVRLLRLSVSSIEGVIKEVEKRIEAM